MLEEILYGSESQIGVKSKKYPGTMWDTKYEGIINFIIKYKNRGPLKSRSFMENFFIKKTCESCKGKRLKKESLHFKLEKKR